MSTKPYFSITKDSFEKNAGYKTTVHALAELIDNAYEAEASQIFILLSVDRNKNLQKIAVLDNGKGMTPAQLQSAVCEKSGDNLERLHGSGKKNSRKLGKYGVGLPKASISQCNKFSVWSWINKGYENAYSSQVDIEDEEWIEAGAKIPLPKKDVPNSKYLKLCGLSKSAHGSIVLWENLDGITWTKARWGVNSGLIPNLEFLTGRTYRKMITGEKPELNITIIICNEKDELIEQIVVKPNDPLYLTAGAPVPRKDIEPDKTWPSEDPLFDDITPENNHIDISIKNKNGSSKKIRLEYKCSIAKNNTYTSLNKSNPGHLPHGKHADKNKGISLLREGREVELSMALLTKDNPRVRWVGVEFNIPHELDSILGMTNNKQGYNRLQQFWDEGFEHYKSKDETNHQCIERLKNEDEKLAICLEISEKIKEVWDYAWSEHNKTRMGSLNTESESPGTSEGPPALPSPGVTTEGEAEKVATKADGLSNEADNRTVEEKKNQKIEFINELVSVHGLTRPEAEDIAKRVIDYGMRYSIIHRSGLGSPFFNVRPVVDSRIIELNKDHAVFKYLLNSLDENAVNDVEELKKRLSDARLCTLLMLEAWAKIESELKAKDKRHLQLHREDWGRVLEEFIIEMENKTEDDQ